ncbi:phage gp6-like head-tail connector protein [Cronobacter sakazakii]|uniref:head-tail connector protein n=1 Tax=Enterobacterales TaxID=91347 RepID=UPI00132B77B7|nr:MULTISPECIES: head-tail connector protein [Enterobacterales]MBS6058296.1 head-tail connector protein [Pantoea sp.]EGT5184270.1 phage gp6-like head-tail connector protein [Cronobacter sakazakii]EGT5705072.1 phage gp6-like head-tail connector protein [Cronobacter sakazakii]EJG0746341.1 phage gp6-like head-tail connector protein [Cronobacter sakazakii]EJG0831720.1 phage gp6-like head-tail connector protein [Cronobacter sakazakii]
MLTVEQVKLHCRIDSDSTEEDEWIAARIKAAVRYVENYTRRKLFESSDDTAYLAEPYRLLYTEDIETAMLMLIAHWYANREAVVTNGSSTTVDLAVESFLQPYRVYGL